MTNCRRGHPLTPENAYVYPDGKKRQCRECKRNATDRYLASPRGCVAKTRSRLKYDRSLKGYWRAQSHSLQEQRERIVSELARLATEEEACLR